MSKEIYISSTPQETRLAIVEKDELTEIYYERENEYTLAGSIYNGRVTRVLPGMQSSFVDIGLERDAFLYITDFMEEAADTADFEGAAASGEPRGGRVERPKSEARVEGRSEGRGRGRRDGRDGERRNREALPETARPDIARPDIARIETRLDEERSFAPIAGENLNTTPRDADADADDLGEGAPGADGGRRWRGRRGRRRGRGADEVQGADLPAVQGAAELAQPREYAQEFAQPQEIAAREGGRDRGGRDRGGRDRGGRDRGGDRGGRSEMGGRSERHDAVRERFAPRGARPASGENPLLDLDASSGPAVEPLILPGESLSKYRRDGNGSATAASTTSATPMTAKPSTEVEPLVGWDGGLVLPGETLSRVREPRRESHPEVRREDRGGDRESGRGGERGRDRRRERDEQRGRSGREENLSGEYRAEPRGIEPREAVQAAVTSQHDVAEREHEPVYPAHHDDVTAGDEAGVEHDTELQNAVVELQETEFQEVTTEYEPEENASASFRVDPAGQREFRQSVPVDEPETATEHEPEAQETGLKQDAVHEAAPDTEIAASAAHAFTTLQPTGELISEMPEAGRAEMAQAEPTGPMEHEAAVQSVHADAMEPAAPVHEAGDHAAGQDEVHDAGQEFAPGDGQLEEELMDEDEAELGLMHASAFNYEGDGDTEEETLEGAANLGSMIRDMTIDDITRLEPAEQDELDQDEREHDEFGDEEDFEEDELASTDEEDFDEDEISGSEVSEAEEEEFAEAASFDENGVTETSRAEGEIVPREGGRDGLRRGRRDGRRGGRDRGSDRGGDRGGSERSAGERSSERSGSRDRRGMAGSRSGGRDRGHRSMQSTNLPAISDLLKPGQEVLVQIAKEPIAKKGARITSHIALPGRFLVFMPTVQHTGVSRKIESDSERRRLKEILLSERGDASGGFIVRTAAAGASEEELRSDLRFLLNLWADIKTRSESSKSPALIYHDLNLIERILRDQVTDNFSAIWVDTESEYERVLRFLQRFQPSLIRRVKLYTKDTPLFEQFGITEEINKALRAKVWLKSGGSIVINQTEALVAIDINTGKFVGKTTKLEDTILKTNLDAIPEIVRQIRLRDLGGIIIIDFIDMDERKNRNRVMAALEEELKSDRAPSKVLQFNDFGLVAITRKRVKQSLERTLSTTCGVCAGTGMVKSPVTVCNDIYIEMRKMHKLIEKGDIMLRVHPEVVKQLKTSGGKWLQEMEEMSGKTILVKSDPALHPEQFDIH